MLLKFNQRGNTLVVALEGELDHHSSESARVKIDNKIDETGAINLVFDFSGVNFMDSSGIGVVIGRYRKVADFGGKVGIINLRPNIKRVFELGGLLKIIKEYNTLDEAVMNW
ncbi:anti-anti-sigma factor [Fervidicella metallireducens AeB]|uniref:Anti-sigma F factor antagonist n=1 Tax=Fervidicella metallireducens AeB TaxID=1403537 RepID=A0A017RW15_9CLOT|nr:anti-sigma F factor antagonist [Fervidicella metallireducens]EYE88090.1 anti-anti-sigma factor [Fervidicella metallireducens AeB]